MIFKSAKIFLILFLLSLEYLSCTKPIPADQGKLLSITASSTAKDSKDSYNISNLNDGTVKSWCEGKTDDGIGESFEMSFEKEVRIQSFFIKNGFGSPNYYSLNNRVEKMKIASEKGDFEEVLFEDTNAEKEIALKKPLTGTKFTFTILSVYSGSKFRDTCITEIGFIKSNIPETASTELCGVSFKKLEVKFSGSNYFYEVSYNDELKGGSGIFRSLDIGCSKPEDFIFDSVTIQSANEGKEFSFNAKAGSTPSSVEANCAPRDIEMSLDSCEKGIEHTRWNMQDCTGKLDGSNIFLNCNDNF